MNILAFDTSTENCSVALLRGDELSGDAVLAGQRHSELLLPMIDALLKQRGASLPALDGIAFSAGPGSFTGLRIACGVAQGLAFGAGLPVAGISTLLALAEAATVEGKPAVRVIACLDARMGEVYHAAYEKRDGQWLTRSEPGLYKASQAPGVSGDDWVGCGSGFAVHSAALGTRYSGQLAHVYADSYPQATAIATLAAADFSRGGGRGAALAAPLYIRNKVALTLTERS
ncbi:MAG: tRNA (adenosine(37)-N6)-threonylcarbamoyltransferase complex dimerization subunit type 1 TsaB [Burkholderiales bacterium]|nr:tRNA (adenosine(37)-N6)-threonylcarbamoyltransferase complex dimerization subunit type 1 TsaB [Burkholderiales bacterium]MDQ3195998.1 tRNA (adenosine(37)-N6)-threonylcarbamoyltransferase complex dimerization subunit type 1 TsaB [Pseudomonadota bacterium]